MKTHEDMIASEKKVYSQNGEDGIIAAIFEEIGTTNRTSVEIGASFDGEECSTRVLAEAGWNAVQFDADARHGSRVRWAYFCAENANEIFQRNLVPKEFDFLSIDVDGTDFWLWNALDWYRPRVVCVEYNANVFGPVTVLYRPYFHWDGSRYFGASLEAFVFLGKAMGYTLVYCDTTGTNAFFVRDDLKEHFEILSTHELYCLPKYIGVDGRLGHPPDPHKRSWFDVTSLKAAAITTKEEVKP